MPNLFSDLPKILSSIENVKPLPTPYPLKISGIEPEIFLATLLRPLSRLFLKLNSSLILSLQTSFCTIQGMFLQLISPLTHLFLLLEFLTMMFSMPSLGLILGRLMDMMEFLLLFSRTVPHWWHPAWSNSFRLCLTTSTFPSCLKYAYIQPVSKKGDRSNPSNYCPVALLSCLSKAFETILNKWFLKLLTSLNFPSDRQYCFRKERSTGDLLAFLTNSWASSLSCFWEAVAVALDISKAFDRVWHKSLLPTDAYGFCPSLCTFISSFLSGRSVSAVVDGYCYKPKSIKSGVPQGSVLSPTLFLFFINVLLSFTDIPIHSYADDSTLHCSITFNSRPSQT